MFETLYWAVVVFRFPGVGLPVPSEKELHAVPLLSRGQSPAESDLNLLETARRCELYGIRMTAAKVGCCFTLHFCYPMRLVLFSRGIVIFIWACCFLEIIESADFVDTSASYGRTTSLWRPPEQGKSLLVRQHSMYYVSTICSFRIEIVTFLYHSIQPGRVTVSHFVLR